MTKPMKYRELTRLLREAGITFLRQGKGDHEVWSAPGLERPVIVTSTREVSPAVTRNALRAIEELERTRED